MSDLRPCPWNCKRAIEITRMIGSERYSLLHRCPVVGPISFTEETAEACVAAWNHRPVEDALKANNDSLSDQLLELNTKLLTSEANEWTPITLENLPKVGDEMCTYVAGEWIVSAVRDDHSVAHYLACGASHLRSIAPPQSEKPSMKSTREIIATNWFGASQPEKEKKNDDIYDR